jgi:hypothetical protein
VADVIADVADDIADEAEPLADEVADSTFSLVSVEHADIASAVAAARPAAIKAERCVVILLLISLR